MERGERERLPNRRGGYNQKLKVGGQTVYIRTGEYADGRLGEIFLDVNKHGTMLRSVLGAMAIAISKGLQYGVPLEEFVRSFREHHFIPCGPVEGDPRITWCDSILDAVFRELELTYVKGELPPRPEVDHAEPA